MLKGWLKMLCADCGKIMNECQESRLNRLAQSISQSVLLGIEYGYKQAEKGHNLQHAISEASSLWNNWDRKLLIELSKHD